MTDSYYCSLCEKYHDVESQVGVRHLADALSVESLKGAIDFTFSAGAHAYISQNTQQYVRDTQVFGLLKDKFSNAGMFAGPEEAYNWLRERLENNQNLNPIHRYLQGHGGGEVDALRQINGSLRGLFCRAEFITNANGHVPSNTAGVDLQVVNRFTGEIVEKIQVKSNWSADPQNIHKTIRDFLSNPHYDENTTLAGPRELIEQARKMGVPNRLSIVSDAHGNELSGERLKKLIERQDASVAGKITFQGVAERAGSGVVIGCAVALTLSTISTFIQYRQGRISGPDAFKQIGIEASRGAVVGGAMGGLSVLFPPGAVGIGVAVFVGPQVRRIVDVAYGKGAYEDLIMSMGAVEASIVCTSQTIAVIQRATAFTARCQTTSANELKEFANVAAETDAILESLQKFRSRGLEK